MVQPKGRSIRVLELSLSGSGGNDAAIIFSRYHLAALPSTWISGRPTHELVGHTQIFTVYLAGQTRPFDGRLIRDPDECLLKVTHYRAKLLSNKHPMGVESRIRGHVQMFARLPQGPANKPVPSSPEGNHTASAYPGFG